jgi:hypothetical protein
VSGLIRRGPSHLPAVAAGPALADRDSLGSPRLAHCAERRSRHRDVSGHVAVLRLRLCDGGVSRLGCWFGDGGNARGHTSLGGSERFGVRDGGLVDPDIVKQASGCDHFSDSPL